MSGALKFNLLLLLMGIICPNAQAEKTSDALINFQPVSPQVSFKAVTELPFVEPSKKIAYGDEPLQFGWFWPAQKTTQAPLVVIVHGGCWLNAFGVDHTFPMATALAQDGHPVWSLEYRRTGDDGGGWPGSFDDIKLALAQLTHVLPKDINTQELVLMGHSAGGHLALLAATENTELDIKHLIGLAAITDISRYALGSNSCQQATPQFMSGMPNERPQAYVAANLIYKKLPANTVLFQGQADQIVPEIQSQLPDVTTEVVMSAGHFDWIHPGSPAFAMLRLILQAE